MFGFPAAGIAFTFETHAIAHRHFSLGSPHVERPA
jgi:hypothetical protein